MAVSKEFQYKKAKGLPKEPDFNPVDENAVTVCITACGRPDLLERTLDSFFKFNTFPVTDILIYEDSGIKNVNLHLQSRYDVRLFFMEQRQGQIAAIDTLYSLVQTPYIFHLEDDWEFYKPGFIEASLPILEKHPDISMVWLRDRKDTNEHPVIWNHDQDFGIMKTNHNGLWGGFCFNPGLRRKSDYDRFGSYGRHTQFSRKKPWLAEAAISKLYSAAGFRAAILPDGYVRHIGEGRHVN